jgi:uncharacterized membrane protein YfcA
MTTRTGLFGWLLVCTALVALWSTTRTPAQEKEKDKPAATKWEYKVITIGTEDRQLERMLNESFGDDGWEVVTATGHVSAKGMASGSGPISTTVQLVLKRPKR